MCSRTISTPFFSTHMTFVLQCCSLQIKRFLTEIVCFYSICHFSNSPNVCGFVIKSPIGRYIRKLYVFQLGNYQLHILIIIHIIIIVTVEDNSCGLLSQYSVIYSRYCPETAGTEFSFSCEDTLICIWASWLDLSFRIKLVTPLTLNSGNC